ncbi:MAG: acyl-CoA dehydrogenase [Myxococcota bacterium]
MGHLIVSLDLSWDEGQQAIFDSLTLFVEDRYADLASRGAGGVLRKDLWRELGALGVLAVGTAEGDGGAAEAVAAAEALGHGAVPGPLAETFFATQVLPEAERRAVAAGESVVSVGVAPWLPWADAADLFVLREPAARGAGRAWLATPAGDVEYLESLGGETWGRAEWVLGAELENSAQGHLMGELVHAAYLAAAGSRLVQDAAEYARTREQFGRPIGSFQAVSHPLADCHMRLVSAGTLALAAAAKLACGEVADAATWAAAARLSANGASLEAVHVCHQVFGAIGITTEGPIFHITRRIRQMASRVPGAPAARARLLEHFGLEEVSDEH